MVCRVSKNDTRQIRALPSVQPLTAAALCRVFWFAECPTLGKPGLCRVLLFAECSALGKPPLCRVSVVCRVLSLWHSANSLFTERPIKSTRQSMGHSAKKPSLVVRVEFIFLVFLSYFIFWYLFLFLINFLDFLYANNKEM